MSKRRNVEPSKARSLDKSIVMRAVRLAKEEGCEKVGECLNLIASAFVKEHDDE